MVGDNKGKARPGPIVKERRVVDLGLLKDNTCNKQH